MILSPGLVGRTSFLTSLLLATVVLGGDDPTEDSAEEPRKPGAFFVVMVMDDEVVMKLVGLDDTRRAALRELYRNRNPEVPEFADRQFESQVTELLSEEEWEAAWDYGIVSLCPDRLSVVRGANVARELELESAQVGEFNEIYRKWLTEGRELISNVDGRAAASVLRRKREQDEPQMNREIDAKLTEAQIARLNEIQLQRSCWRAGATVFTGEDVSAKLQLSESQRDKLKTMVRERAGRESFQQLLEEYKRGLETLSRAQHEEWLRMLGEPIKRYEWFVIPVADEGDE